MILSAEGDLSLNKVKNRTDITPWEQCYQHIIAKSGIK